MKIATHNSATGGRLVWWQRPIGWLLHLTSRCQDRTIDEQLEDGVKYFNLQVGKYKGVWVFSHGMAIYEEELIPSLAKMKLYATSEEPIFFNLYLDNSFILGQNEEEFRELVKLLQEDLKGENVKMHYAWIEGSKEYFYSDVKVDVEEHYWTFDWALDNASSIWDILPLPKRHAQNYNAAYKANCTREFLMLDFYEID